MMHVQVQATHVEIAEEKTILQRQAESGVCAPCI